MGGNQLTEEQEDLIYDLEREFPVTYQGNYIGGRFVADRNTILTGEMVNDIMDMCNDYGFGVSVFHYDEDEVKFDFDNYHGTSSRY